MDFLTRRLKRAFWFTLALIFLFESWLWDNVKEWLRAASHALGLQNLHPWLQALVSRLSPPMTLVLFAVPAVLIFPFKVAALALIAHGYFVTGLIAIFAAKTFALGVTSYLFDICREKLLQMNWFVRFYSVVLDARAWASALIAPAKAQLHAALAILRTGVSAFLGAENGSLGRRLARLRELTRVRKSA